MEERRAKPRQRVFKAGTIEFDGSGVDCTIRNMSATGAALDVASLPQSVDRVGSFRYTTKISEYLAAGLPIATGRIPLAYDLDDGAIWRLPGTSPWDPTYVAALTNLMSTIDPADLTRRRAAVTPDLPLFDRARQQRLVREFLVDVLD